MSRIVAVAIKALWKDYFELLEAVDHGSMVAITGDTTALPSEIDWCRRPRTLSVISMAEAWSVVCIAVLFPERMYFDRD